MDAGDRVRDSIQPNEGSASVKSVPVHSMMVIGTRLVKCHATQAGKNIGAIQIAIIVSSCFKV